MRERERERERESEIETQRKSAQHLSCATNLVQSKQNLRVTKFQNGLDIILQIKLLIEFARIKYSSHK